MQINRRPATYRRRGPSCLTVLFILVAIGVIIYLSANANTVIEAIVPTPTPEPTRSAPSFATSAQLYRRDKEYDQAIESYEKAIQLDPENASYYVELINLLTLLGEADKAREWAERVSVVAPDDDQVLTAVASSYLLNGSRLSEIGERAEAESQYQRAIDSAEEATRINPNNAEAYAVLAGAVVLQNRDNFPIANEFIETAMAIASDDAKVRYYRGVVLETQGYYQRAIDEYEAARQIEPGYIDPAISLAYAYYYNDNSRRALVILEDLIAENPDNAAAHDALGFFLLQAGQHAEAETYLIEAVQLDPDMIRARAHLGAAYFRNNKYADAVAELEIATESYDTVLQTNAVYFNMLGFAYFYLNPENCNVAEPLFRQVLESPNVDADTFNGQNAQIGLEECRQAGLGN